MILMKASCSIRVTIKEKDNGFRKSDSSVVKDTVCV